MKEVEKQTIEWKESWHDEYLKWICGYANAYGGTLFIGKDDNGKPVGGVNLKKLLTQIPDKVISTMGIVPDIDVEEENGVAFIAIKVDHYSNMISYRGKYYYRTGSTMRELTGVELDKRLLKSQGRSWDAVSIQDLSVRQLSKSAIKLFKKKAVERGRLTKEEVRVSDSVLMEKLHLLDDGGNLVRAAMLAFHPDPEKWITGSYIKIGYFGKSDADLQYQDDVHGPLIEQIDETVDLVYTKYMKALIDYEGIQRVEQFMFHKNAFRELLINAVVRKDYASCNPIQISVYADQIYIWNSGEMPRAFWSSAKLYKKHNSIPYNPKLAEVFFKSGMIEAWGRSFEKIREACAEYDNAPLPKIDVSEDGVMVHCLPCKRYVRLLKQNDNSLISNERIMSGLMSGKTGDRLRIILNYLNSHDTINTEIAASITGKSESQAKRYLGALEKAGQIRRTKTTKGNAYVRI